LYSAWQFSDCYAWGLATANPFAVRALETATRRACQRSLITKRADTLLDCVRQSVDYLPDQLVERNGNRLPIVDTNFHVSHENLDIMRRRAARSSRPWALGDIEDGQEWLACTFADQPPADVASDRLEHLFETNDAIWIDAYERMALDTNHRWHAHAPAEIAHILQLVGQPQPTTALDVGCGDGRHVRVLADRGVQVVGIDLAAGLIAKAQSSNPDLADCLWVADAREPSEQEPRDLILALYDVIGSSARREDDLRILMNIRDWLAPGGTLVLSVMNAGCLTLPEANLARDEAELVSLLERLAPSNSMETTGSVFDPSHLLRFGQDVYFRKEQFQREGDWLPAELVIRDRRFTRESIIGLLEEAELEVIELVPVQSGQWDREPRLAFDDARAKELLVTARLKS
jgi:SAM-dependent methyltransferase